MHIFRSRGTADICYTPAIKSIFNHAINMSHIPAKAAFSDRRVLNTALKTSLTALFLFLGAMFLAPQAHAATPITGSIQGTMIAEGSPYVVSGYTYVAEGNTLTVEEGVYIKFLDANASLTIQGTLDVNGTEADPVLFTAYADDSDGNDTNNDGPAGFIPGGSWRQVTVKGTGTATLDHAIFKYGGALTGSVSQNAVLGSCLRVEGNVTANDSRFSTCYSYGVTAAGGSFTATNSEFDTSWRGIFHIGGTASVSGSSFHDNSNYAVWSGSVTLNYVTYVPDGDANAANNWWGSPSGPTMWDGYGIQPGGQLVNQHVIFLPILDQDPVIVSPLPIVSDIAQYQVSPQGEATLITEGDTVTDTRDLRIEAVIGSADGSDVRLQAEIRPISEPLTNIPTHDSGLLPSGSTAQLPILGLQDNDYHFQVRAMDVAENASEWTEFGTAGNTDVVVDYTQVFSVAVVRVVTNDPGLAQPDSSTLTQPCKLLDQNRTYTTYDEFLEDMFVCVNDYYSENTYGKYKFSHELLNVDDSAFSLTHPASYYVDNATRDEMSDESVSLAGISGEQFDIVITVYTEPDGSDISAWAIPQSPPSSPLKRIIVSSDHTLGAWAHEIGHVFSGLATQDTTFFPDLYKMGNIRKWGLMAKGSLNGGLLNNNGTDPSSMTSVTREFLGLVDYEAVPSTYRGDSLMYVESSKSFGNSVFMQNIVEDSAQNEYQFYVAELRDKGHENWDSSLSGVFWPKAVVYYVNNNGYDKYGWVQNVAGQYSVEFNGWSIDIPGLDEEGDDLSSFNNGILNVGEKFHDFDNKFSYELREESGQYYLSVSDFDPASSVGDNLTGVVLKTKDWFLTPFNFFDVFNQKELSETVFTFGPDHSKRELSIEKYKIFSRICFVFTVVILLILIICLLWRARKFKGQKRFLWKLFGKLEKILAAIVVLLVLIGSFFYFKVGSLYADGVTYREGSAVFGLEDPEARPDFDLHIYCPDGRHVGMNYETGEYEVQIEGTITNGDNLGAPEWIFFPPTPENEGCVHSVSAHDNEVFLEENPEIAVGITDTTGMYEIYARYIDPSSGIFTSEVLEAQTIMPGKYVTHAVSGTTDVSIDEGIIDDTPPATTVILSGTEGLNGWFLSGVEVSFSAEDNVGGLGVDRTEYSLDNGATWIEYDAPFVIADDGVYTIMYRSTDNAGNIEDDNALETKIDTIVPETFIPSGPSAETYFREAILELSSDEPGTTFTCSLDNSDFTACVSPAEYTNLTAGPHTFQATSTDEAGNSDPTPAEHIWTILEGGTIEVKFQRHTVGQGSSPGSNKEPVTNALINAYSKASGSCADGIGSNPHDYYLILDTCAPDFSAPTNEEGVASLTTAPGNYILISADPITQVIAGVSSGDIQAGETVQKFIQVIVRADGSSVPAKTTKKNGSVLYIIEPEYIEWDSEEELYPFVFDSEGDWGVTVNIELPEGFISDHDSLSAEINSDYVALQFTLTDTGSCWHCGTGIDMEIAHNGSTEHITRNIPTPMTEAFVLKKGLKVEDMESSGVRVTGKGAAVQRPGLFQRLLESVWRWILRL